METKLFNIKDLPDFKDNNIAQKSNLLVDNIYNNYVVLIKDIFKIIEISLEKKISKPIILYNLFFLLELFLKFYIIKNSKMQIEEIEKNTHSIWNLIDQVNKLNQIKKFEKIKDMIRGLKSKNGQALDLNKYYHYRYNRLIGTDNLIFDYELSELEKNKIKEVMEWINYHIQIL